MPFKSEAQRRLFHAKANRGEISEETVKRWEAHTSKGKKLPERKHKKKACVVVAGKLANLDGASQIKLACLLASRHEKQAIDWGQVGQQVVGGAAGMAGQMGVQMAANKAQEMLAKMKQRRRGPQPIDI